jgi:nucleoside 2-deoxyribosyltransferase
MMLKGKVYVAAPFKCKDEAKKALTAITEAGFGVTARWIYEHPEQNKGDYSTFRKEAQDDLMDITRSDVLVLLNLTLSEGKAFEAGFAIAMGIPVVVVGEISPTSNVFYYLDTITKCATLNDAINYCEEFCKNR